MTRPIDAHAAALKLLARDARDGKPGAAQAYERALWRKDRADTITTKRELADEAKHRGSTSRHLLDGQSAAGGSAALDEAMWRSHNLKNACLCDGCYGYARDLLQDLCQHPTEGNHR